MFLDVVEDITVNILLCHQFPRIIDSNVLLIPSICRLSKENNNDAQPSSIDWLELIEAVNKVQKQSCKFMIVSLILEHYFMMISQVAAIIIRLYL